MLNYFQITKIQTIGQNQNSESNPTSVIESDLKWRNKTLVVNAKSDPNKLDVIALKADWWLVNCLQKSPVTRICVTPNIGSIEVKNWAIAGEKTKKQVFLRISSNHQLSMLQKSLSWKIKRLMDLVIATIGLLLLSPLVLAIACKQKLNGKHIFERQWCVGRRGLIFQTFDWADNKSNSRGNLWVTRFGLHKLPQLINVLRGEMSLIGHYPFSLTETVDFNTTQRKVLNTLPGVISTTPWRSPQADIRAMSIKSYNYLCHWSLISDLKILFLILPRLLRGRDSHHKIVKL